jgi:hypothetical protein
VRRTSLAAAIVAIVLMALPPAMDAHKPITSPFTYSADVLPILRERCGSCHAPGGVAPMSLLTHHDAVPWAESMRVELSAGRMPPWNVDRGVDRFRGPGTLTARELNVLLTWATGGTPAGDITTDREPAAVMPTWGMGAPDAVLELPTFTLAAHDQEQTAEFMLPLPAEARALRGIDILPGTPAIVRSATVDVEPAVSEASSGTTKLPAGVRDERRLALWVPGERPALLADAALSIPANSMLRVRVRYRKTWSYEGKAITDRSRVGLYFAPAGAPAIGAVSMTPEQAVTLPQPLRAVAIYAEREVINAGVTVTATRPDGRRQELIAFHPRPGWTRRFWFREPVLLPRGTRLSVRLVPDPTALLPASVSAASARPPSTTARITVNVAL